MKYTHDLPLFKQTGRVNPFNIFKLRREMQSKVVLWTSYPLPRTKE